MGRILVIVGLSGNGKSRLARGVLEAVPNSKMVISDTTRQPRRDQDIFGEYRYHTSGRSAFDDTDAFLWVTPPLSGELYGTTKEAVTEVLDSKSELGIMILVPNVLHTLNDFVREHIGDTSCLTFVFIQPLRLTAVRKRVRLDSGRYRQVAERHEAEKKWPRMVRESLLPFHYVSNEGSPEETLDEVLELLRAPD